MYCMVRSLWHLLPMSGGSLLVKNEWVKKECPILTLARVTSCCLFKLKITIFCHPTTLIHFGHWNNIRIENVNISDQYKINGFKIIVDFFFLSEIKN